MSIDWQSPSTEVLLNPRIPEKERTQFSRQLSHCDLQGHVWLTTSGTSGRFKFVALPKEGILCSASAVNKHLESDSSDVWVHVLPDFHVGGLGIWARGHLSGAKVVKYNSKWDPSQFYQLAKESCATLTALVPTQIHDLVNNHLQAPPSIRATIVGGGVLVPSLYEKAQHLGWKLLPSYGLTECASQVATAKHGQYDEANILSHVRLRIDLEGFICIKSDSLLTVYGENSRFFDPKVEGWFTTEDKGELCGDALKVFGRGSDFVKIGGESVNIPHLQKVLEELKISLQISQNVVIVAVQDDRLGHVIHCVVEGKKNPQIEKLIEAYQEKVMPYECARETHYVKEIPRNSLGKICKSMIETTLNQKNRGYFQKNVPNVGH